MIAGPCDRGDRLRLQAGGNGFRVIAAEMNAAHDHRLCRPVSGVVAEIRFRLRRRGSGGNGERLRLGRAIRDNERKRFGFAGRLLSRDDA